MFVVHLLPLALVILLSSNAILVQDSPLISPESVPYSNLLETMPISTNLNRGDIPYRPPQVPLDVEHYPVAPHELELKQVHVFVRHGERTPVGVRLSAPPASIPEHWMMCWTARRLRAAVSAGAAVAAEERKTVERIDGTSQDGECLLGELTDLGRLTTYNYGIALRKLYVDKLGFLPDSLNQDGIVYFRSTNIPRTIESLQHVIHGLYPTSQRDPAIIPSLVVRNGKDENLIRNTLSCKRLDLLHAGFAQAAATAYNPILESLDQKLSKYLGGNPIRVDGKPRLSGILDTIRAATANGVKVPPEFEDQAVVDVLERAVLSEWFAGEPHPTPSTSHKTEEVRRLGMGRLLDDISRKMGAKAQRGDPDPLKILVHSTHDAALAALCSTLDVFDEKWPAFTASATFELFRRNRRGPEVWRSNVQTFMSSLRAEAQPEHYVRMRYQNKTMVLPICAAEGKHLPGSPEFCTLAAFQERVKELTPVDWDGECAPAGR